MVNKYDFELDLNGDNSNSLIVREITPGSKILEFGPAFGRMTKYLSEAFKCKVTIVEKDSDAGSEAKQYSESYYVGNYWGDIEKYNWSYDLVHSEEKFDYIIWADVLEHLYDPWKALTCARQFLKDDGYMLISVPNISHNSILIELMKDKFEYRDIGLLDNTHIRFFTRSSLTAMVEQAGLEIKKVMDAKNAVEYTEFKNSYNDVPDAVAAFLKEREDGHVYQFVWKLGKKVE